MSWGQFVVRGTPYDLTHLDPFTMTVRPQAAGAPIRRVRVKFGSHCFTRDVDVQDHSDFHFQDGKATRTFCLMRHRWSLDLPALIRAARSGYAYSNGHKRNFLLVKPQNGAPYTAFFNVNAVRSKKLDAVMTVVSAYEKPNLLPEFPSVPFVALIGQTANNLPITPGPIRKW